MFEDLLTAYVIAQLAIIMPPQLMQDIDEAFWGPLSNGNFSQKTTYNGMTKPNPYEVRWPWGIIWKWFGPQRVKTFFWLFLHKGVMTNEEKAWRRIVASSICKMCGQHVEMSMHMLRDCFDARAISEGLIRPGELT